MKDIEGKIDEEQFGAYVDELLRPEHQGVGSFDKLRYVFTKPEGAIANLEFMATQMTDPDLAGRLSVEVFDSQGTPHYATSRNEAMTLLKLLKAKQ